MTDHTHDKELGVLKTVLEREAVHQRDIAQVVGMSVGMTNAIVKRLSKKGYLTVRKVNNRNIRYAVTPDGVDEIARRSYRYLKSTIKSVVDYKESIGKIVRRAAREGYTGVVLIGKSDVDFIVEHQCAKNGLHYRRTDAAPAPATAGDAGDAGNAANAGEADPSAGPEDAGGPGARSAEGALFEIYSERHDPPAGQRAGGAPARNGAGDGAAYLREVLARA